MYAFLLLPLLAVGTGGAGPATYTLSGRVTDSAGTALPNVRVTILEAGRATQTDAGGRYAVPNLPDGTFGVSLSYVGYAPVVRRVTIAGRDLTLDVVLRRSLIELPPVQVTATPLATSVLSSPQPVAVVAGTSLREAQAASLGETLRGVSGVQNLSNGVGIGKPVIRGLTSNRVLVLDNGQRLETAQWGDEHGPNLETAAAERIEVIKGPASVLYGSDALGGVINVVARDLPFTAPGTRTTHGTLTGSYGTNNRAPDGALLLEGASGGLGWRAAATGRRSEDLRTPDYTLWNSGNQATSGSAAVGGRGAWGTFTLSGSHRNERIALTDEDPTATSLQRIETTRGRADLMLPLGQARLEADLGYERNRRREFEEKASDDVALGLLTRTITGDLTLHHPALGALNGIVGFSGIRTRFDKFGEETLIPNSTALGAGLFAFEQVESGRWSLSFGARLDHRRLDVKDDGELGVTAQRRSWNSVTGNLGILYHVSEPVALVVNLGRGFRAPSSFDLFSNGVHKGTLAFERGNPALRNETSFNADAALRVQTSRVALELGGFANFIQDFIYSVPTGTTDPASGYQIYDVTQGNARLTGVEASAQYHPLESLHLQATVDYTRGQNATTGDPLPLMPPLRATYSARWEGRQRGTMISPYLMLGGETNARQLRLDPAEAAFYASAFDGVGYRSRGYTLVNAGAGIGVLVGGTVLRADISVRNVLDVRYASFLSRIKTNALDPGMGRNVILKMSADF